MKKRDDIKHVNILCCIVLIAAFSGVTGWANTDSKTPTMPVMFERNVGQAGADVTFVARGAGFQAHVKPSEAVVVYGRKQAASVVRMQLAGARQEATMRAGQPLTIPVSYARTDADRNGTTMAPVFESVRAVGVYEGIDLVWRGCDGHLVYDFEVAAGADPSRIAWSYSGVESVSVDAAGALLVATKRGVIRQAPPVTFQMVDGTKRIVESGFNVIGAGMVGFRLGAYDRTQPLVIDPTVTYSTYLGGGNVDGVQAVEVDAAGHVYVVGETDSPNFSVTVGAHDTTYNGNADVLVAKFHRNTGALMYATYLGGGADDSGFDLAVDGQGNVYVTGLTDSTDFPTTLGAHDRTLAGDLDGFVTKINPAGNALVYSTYVGGTGFEFFTAIDVDAQGNAYVTGNSDDASFPVTVGAFDTTENGGLNDVVVFKLNPAGSALVFSTFIGGSGQDEGNGLTLTPNNEVVVTGFTDSPNYPVTAGALDATKGGRGDAFVTKLNATGTALVSSTYLGGNLSSFATSFAGYDAGYDVKLDALGNLYVVGETVSSNFPVTVNAFRTQLTGVYEAFVAKLSPGMSNLVYATFIGGGGDEFARAATVDPLGAVRVCGKTISQNFPVTIDAFQINRQGAADAFLTELAFDGSALAFSSYWGGSQSEDAFGLRHDALGNVVMVGDTDSSNYLVTVGAHDTTYNTDGDAYLAKFAMEQASMLSVTVLPESDAIVSVPFELPPVYTGTVTGVSGNTLTVSGLPAGSYGNTHYVRFTSGAKNGLWGTVSSNGAGTLTLADSQVASGIVAGVTLKLHPHQTLDSVLPASLEGVSFRVSSSATVRSTEVLMFDNQAVGINKSSSATYYYLSGGWRKAGAAGSFGGVVIAPGQSCVVRNKNNSKALSFVTGGLFVTGNTGQLVPTNAILSNDLYLASQRPIAVTLNELMLGGTPAFASSTSATQRADELLVFNNGSTGQNKSSSATFYYLAGVWRQVGSSADWGNVAVIEPSAGFMIRKKNGTAGTAVWTAITPY